MKIFVSYFHISSSDYLCSPEANVYDIDFTRFKIRDMETGTVLFEIAKPPPPPGSYFILLPIKLCFCWVISLIGYCLCILKAVTFGHRGINLLFIV